MNSLKFRSLIGKVIPYPEHDSIFLRIKKSRVKDIWKEVNRVKFTVLLESGRVLYMSDDEIRLFI